MKTSALARTFNTAVLSAALALAALNASAALYDRGNGMIYDSTQNITWLQDANYVKTSGYSDTGALNWYEAKSWASNLVYGGYSDWRLPLAKPIGDINFSYDGSTDVGFNNTRNELSHLFFELGNYSSVDAFRQYQGQDGWSKSTFIDPITQQNVSFLNISQNGIYWNDESCCGYQYFMFTASVGAQDLDNAWRYVEIAWAVRDGDVLAVNEVPIPATAWLMGSGLLGLAALARRRK